MSEAKNVLGEPLEACSLNPKTGYTRSGSCETGPQDLGPHTVCAQVTVEVLEFRVAMADLKTHAIDLC